MLKGQTSCYILLLFVVLLSVCCNALAQPRACTKIRISSGYFNHESPSINNPGDVVCRQSSSTALPSEWSWTGWLEHEARTMGAFTIGATRSRSTEVERIAI